jgi:DNA repair exonuclease SbcCD ATPase subunit
MDDIQHNRRSTDNTAIVTFLQELEGQVKSLKTMQLTYDGVTNRFIKDLERLGETVDSVIKKYQESSPASMEDVRDLHDSLKDQVQDLEIQLQKILLFYEQLKENVVKIEKTQQGMITQDGEQREHLLMVDNSITRIQQEYHDVKAKLSSLELAHKDLVTFTSSIQTSLRALKHFLVIIAGIFGFVATVIGIYQSLFPNKP